MRAVPGYTSVDLTRLTESNGGQCPRQEVYDAIDGRKRFPAHFIGDMPTWGLKYQTSGAEFRPSWIISNRFRRSGPKNKPAPWAH